MTAPGALEPQIILVDKPAGITSHDVVFAWRRELRELDESGSRLLVGHAGTLDPFATGLLILVIGQAAKAQAEFMGSDKRYLTTLQLGAATDTGDLTGTVAKTAPVPSITKGQIEQAFQAWPSPFTQAVPAYAAAKVDGRKLYDYARRGDTPSRWPIRICRASDWQLEKWDPKTAVLTFSVTVTAGCYVRALGETLAAKLGTVGHLTALRRLSGGSFSVEDAVSA